MGITLTILSEHILLNKAAALLSIIPAHLTDHIRELASATSTACYIVSLLPQRLHNIGTDPIDGEIFATWKH